MVQTEIVYAKPPTKFPTSRSRSSTPSQNFPANEDTQSLRTFTRAGNRKSIGHARAATSAYWSSSRLAARFRRVHVRAGDGVSGRQRAVAERGPTLLGREAAKRYRLTLKKYRPCC